MASGQHTERVFGIEVKGIKQWQLALASMDDHIRKNMEAAMFRAGVKVQARAQEILTEKGHVVTGNLRRSILTSTHVDPSGKGWFVRIASDTDELAKGFEEQKAKASEAKSPVAVGTFVYYAPYIEALPDGGFMLPAFLEKKEEVLKDLAAVIEKSIEVYNRKAKQK